MVRATPVWIPDAYYDGIKKLIQKNPTLYNSIASAGFKAIYLFLKEEVEFKHVNSKLEKLLFPERR